MIINCKMCGSEIHCNDNEKVVTCEFCGSKQSIPETNDTHEIELFNLANNYRIQNRYDQAIAIYKQIIDEFPNEIEAHWGLLLCEYGIEYVDDILTNSKIPTCHRTKDCSIFDDEEYKLIIEKAPTEKKIYYQEEAKRINDLQNEIKQNVNDTKYDIFICYKETDFDGNRTKDSQYASLFYSRLTQKGYKVFYAKESLKNVIGNYEPYIYSALRSARIMLVLGTKKEFIEAPWVRNEWSRFLEFSRKDLTKRIAPMIGFSEVYDLPEELQNYQVQDLRALDFLESLLRSVDSVFNAKEEIKVEVKEPEVDKFAEDKKEFELYKTTTDDAERSMHLLAAVTNDYPPALAELGKCYLKGGLFAKDETKAHEYLNKALELGSFEAKATLGLIYLDEENDDNYQKAFEYLKESAEKEIPDGMYGLAKCYQEGIGTEENKLFAINYYKKAADKGNADAQYELACIFDCGDGIEVDIKASIYYYKLAATNGSTDAMLSLGKLYENGFSTAIEEDHEKALSCYSEAFKKGRVEGLLKIGCLYLNKGKNRKDKKKAFEYLDQASRYGNTEAMNKLGHLYYYAKKYNLSFKYFKMAEKYDDPEYFDIAQAYHYGLGTKKDESLALKYYRLGALDGDEICEDCVKELEEKGVTYDN